MSLSHFIVDWKIRLPGSRTPVNFPLHLDMTAGEAINVITRHFSMKSKRFTVVISPTNTKAGRIIPDETVFRRIKEEVSSDDILELWRNPYITKTAVVEGVNTIGYTQELVVDSGSQLSHMIPIFQRAFGVKEEFSFQYVPLTDVNANQVKNATWLSVSDSLLNQRVPQDAYLLVHPLSIFEKFSYSQVSQMGIIKEGILIKQSQTKNKKSKFQKRWFVLADGFLFYFRNKGDSSSRGVLTLEYYGAKLEKNEPSSEKKYPSWMIQLSKIFVEEFASKHGDAYLLSGPEQDVQSWYDALADKVYNSGNRKEFGVELQQAVQRRLCKNNLPRVISDCVECLRQEYHLQQEGLFRVPGSASLIEYYKDQYDQGEEVVLSDCTDTHTISGLLKLYMRELPEPLVTWALYEPLLNAYETFLPQGDKVVVEQLTIILSRLPSINLSVLKYICSFLFEAGKHHLSSKMTVSNLATVFGPNLIRKEIDDPATLMKHAQTVNNILELMINNQHIIFGNWVAPSMERRPSNPPVPAFSFSSSSFSSSSSASSSFNCAAPTQQARPVNSLKFGMHAISGSALSSSVTPPSSSSSSSTSPSPSSSSSSSSSSQDSSRQNFAKSTGTWTMGARKKTNGSGDPLATSQLSPPSASSIFTPGTSSSSSSSSPSTFCSSVSINVPPPKSFTLPTTTGGTIKLSTKIRPESEVNVNEERIARLQQSLEEEMTGRQKAEAQLEEYKKRLKDLESKFSKILPLLQAD